MKFVSIAICICVLQMYSISVETSYVEGNFREYLGEMRDVSKQFLDDVDKIIEIYENDAFVMYYLDTLTYIMTRRVSGPKISVSNVRSYLKQFQVVEYDVIDMTDILKTILSRELPPERFNGVLSLGLALRNGATDYEIEKALGYFYGSEANPPQPNIPALDTTTCSTNDRAKYFADLGTNIIGTFKEIKGLNPKVIQDVNGIFEKFPCNGWIFSPLERIAKRIAYGFDGKNSTINSCVIKEKLKDLPNLIFAIGSLINKAEAVLSARLPQEKFSGIVDIIKILSNPDATKAEIDRALTYLYGKCERPTSC